MHLIQQNIQQLNQVKAILNQLNGEQYVQPLEIYNNSTIGQHFRHLIEFYLCLKKSVQTEKLNYDARKRDLKIETDLDFAKAKVIEIIAFINEVTPNLKLDMVVNYGMDESDCTSLSTNLTREIAFCLDHTVHHLAIIKIGLKEMGVQLNDKLGIAPSTLRNQNKCAQ